jgi:hypothetical protein
MIDDAKLAMRGRAVLLTMPARVANDLGSLQRGADELFWRGVLDPRDRALDQALVGRPR